MADVEENDFFENILRIIGKKTFNYIINKGVRDLHSLVNLELSPSANTSSEIINEIKSIQKKGADYLNSHIFQNSNMNTDSDLYSEEDDENTIYNELLNNLSTRAKNILQNNNISNIKSFLNLSCDDISQFKNSGIKTSSELIAAKYKLANFFSDDSQIQSNKSSKKDKTKHNKTKPSPQHLLVNKTRIQISNNYNTLPYWTILNKTLLDLFDFDQETIDNIWNLLNDKSISIIDLPDSEWKKLEDIGIFKEDQFEIILSISIRIWLRSEILPETFDLILTFISEISNSKNVNLQSIISPEPIITNNDVINIKHFLIDTFEIQTHLLNQCNELGYKKWIDLLNINEKDLLKVRNTYLESFRLIYNVWEIKEFGRIASGKIVGFSNQTFNSINNLIEDIILKINSSERDKNIFLGRLGLLENRHWSLEELGNKFNLTRERIRQIELRFYRMIKHHRNYVKLSKLWYAIKEIIRSSGGICSFQEMSTQISTKLEWDEQFSDDCLEWFLSFISNIIIDHENNLIFDSDFKCFNCTSIITNISNIFIENKNDKSINEVIDKLSVLCSENPMCNPKKQGLYFSRGFITYLTLKTNDLSIENDIVYSRTNWGAKYGSNLQLIENILMKVGKPLHYNEIYEELIKDFPDNTSINNHSVHSALQHSEMVLLWGPGTYIHCNNVDFPKDLISKIEISINNSLKANVPYIFIYSTFIKFKKQCEEYGIISEYALYSCLRKTANSLFVYPRFPQIYLAESFTERIPLLLTLEQFIQESGGITTIDEIREFAINQIGLKESYLFNYLPQLSNVIRKSKDEYIHIDNLQIDKNKLESINIYIQNILKTEDHISIVKVFNNKTITCVMIGVDHPEMLYSILKLFYMDSLDLSSYPQVRTANKNGKNTKSIVDEISNYILNKNAPCSYDEIESRFVDELGYSQQSAYSINIRPEIYRYSVGTLIHKDTIGWNMDKQHDLELKAQDEILNSNKSGRTYGLINNLLQFQSLPELNNNTIWTHTLLSSLLNGSDKFLILGSARNAFVSIPNDNDIETFEDLIYTILSNKYDGAVELNLFENYLRDSGIVKKRLTSGMLGNQIKVCINNNLIMLKELNQRA